MERLWHTFVKETPETPGWRLISTTLGQMCAFARLNWCKRHMERLWRGIVGRDFRTPQNSQVKVY
jgi:hypothetical protein